MDAIIPERLTKRADFLACAKALACARGALVVQSRPRADGDARVRAGFTATRRIGGAGRERIWGCVHSFCIRFPIRRVTRIKDGDTRRL